MTEGDYISEGKSRSSKVIKENESERRRGVQRTGRSK